MDQNNLFREAYSIGVVHRIAEQICAAWDGFVAERFLGVVLPGYEDRGFGDRARRIVAGLEATLPEDFPEAAAILVRALGPEPNPESELTGFEGFYVVPYTMYVSRHGMEHLETSLDALYEMTKRFSAESEIRPFLLRYPVQTIEFLRRLTTDVSPYARRLASEGTRPRLPLASRLPAFQRDPAPVIGLLDALVTDPSEMVRRSVANNVNDISKDNPEIAVETLRTWRERYPRETTERIIRHALRTLIKRDHPGALALLGFETTGLALESWTAEPSTLALGGALTFCATLASTVDADQKIALNYVIHFVKARGERKPKVFRLPDKTLSAGGTLTIERTHVFRDYRNQRFYPGTHRIELVANGRVLAGSDFQRSL